MTNKTKAPIHHVGLYIRTALAEDTREGTSIRKQRDSLLRHANERGYKVHDVYVDNGYSGLTLDRPALKRLLADCKAKRVKRIVVYGPDRLYRGPVEEMVSLLKDLLDSGIQIEVVTENVDFSFIARVIRERRGESGV